MYNVIGGDQKEYGPIPLEELRRWILEGRLNGQSLARVDGATERKPLSGFPEFAEALRMQAGQFSPGIGGPPASQQAWIAEVTASRPQLEIGRCLGRSWSLLQDNFGLLLGGTFVVWLIESLLERIPIINMFSWVIHGVFYGGLYLVFLNRIRGRPATVGDVFAGFSPTFPQLLLVGLITVVLSKLGWFVCILPGLYLGVAWTFSVPLVADKGLEFWTAMELSRKVVTRVWFEVFGLLIVAFLPVILVNIFAFVKVTMIAVPVVSDIINSGKFDPTRFTDLMLQVAKTGLPLWFLTKVALLLNLPFALGALMYGYEALFGPRAERTA